MLNVLTKTTTNTMTTDKQLTAMLQKKIIVKCSLYTTCL